MYYSKIRFTKEANQEENLLESGIQLPKNTKKVKVLFH